ncbi:MAG: phosphate ABC transporter substrate-binding protein [Oscillospiraceae bacterium]|nr:phosphate ABC transporter substrate-binding protein [Oscillospiraceae bacterium]
MNIKRTAAGLCAALLLAACFTGCGSSASDPASNASGASAAISGKVSTGGSTSMEKVVAALQEGFAELRPDVTVTYDPTGSGAGITGAMEQTLDIGLSSRDLKDSETGVTGTVVALDGIAVIVNNTNGVDDLSIEQIAAIAKGEVTNWSELGGADVKIAVIGREAGSGTRDGFESIVGVEDVCAYDQELTSTGAVITAVSSNEGAIGYASLSALKDTVKAVTVDGVVCSESTVLDGTYAIQRPFVFVTNDSVEPSAAVLAFLAFAASPEAADLIRIAGAVPLA